MSSGTSSELSSMESVSQLVLTIERLEGNQLWPVFCRRRNGSPLCDTVTVTAELDEVTVTALNEEQTFTNSR